MTKIREHLENVLKAEGTFRDREYSICDDRGYLIDVLQPIIDARDGITECVKIRPEHETHYDWVAFVPQPESDAGEDDFKIRGIEAR